MFNATTFDTGRGIDNMIVFDQNGIFSSTFPYNGNPANNGDTPPGRCHGWAVASIRLATLQTSLLSTRSASARPSMKARTMQ